MFFEEAQYMSDLHSISPELSCTCDEVHTCQQCMIEEGYEPAEKETDEEFAANMANNLDK